MRPGYPTVASATPLQTRSGPVLRVHLSGQEVLAGGDGQGEDVVSADRGEPAAGRAAPQTQSGSARLVRLLPVSRATGFCPPAAMKPAHWWPPFLPTGGHETADRAVGSVGRAPGGW